jgi:cyclophilin family peptidyl-prolyl cis-trans isomerase
MIGGEEPKEIVIGLYEDLAPSSTKLFRGLCSGSVPGAPGLSYRSSTSPRVEPGKAITLGKLSAGSSQVVERSIDGTGYVRSELVSLADTYTNTDDNSLSHDRAGVVSMQRSGGAFEFLVTPAANPALDATHTVIGEVVSGLDAVAAMNAVPVRKPSNQNEVGALIYNLGAYDETKYLAVAKAGGDPRSRVDNVFKPLQKIKIVDCDSPR